MGVPYALAGDSLGGIYVAGSVSGSRDPEDAWLAKWDTAGNQKWRRQFGAADSEGAWDVAVDGGGKIYVTGTTDGSLGGLNQGTDDMWLAKYGPAGKMLWTQQLGTAAMEQGKAVTTDFAGNIYVAGSTYGSLNGPNRGDLDVFLAKFPPR